MVSMYFNPALESEQDRSDQELIAIRAQREEEIHRVCVAGPLCIQGNKILSDIFFYIPARICGEKSGLQRQRSRARFSHYDNSSVPPYLP
jgi:hypothetical protein